MSVPPTGKAAELVCHHRPVVHHVVAEVSARLPGVDAGVLRQVGENALAEAARTWDGRSGFAGFALLRVRAAVHAAVGGPGHDSTSGPGHDGAGSTGGPRDDVLLDSALSELLRQPQLRELHRAALAQVHELPKRLQAVVERTYLHGRPASELAPQLHVTELELADLRRQGIAWLSSHPAPTVPAPRATAEQPQSPQAHRRAARSAAFRTS